MSASSKSSIQSFFEARNHCRDAFSVLHEMRGNMELCDVTLKVGNLTLTAHRAVLAATSPFFRKEFSSSEADRPKDEFIMADNIQPESMAALVEFLYTGTLQINAKNIEDLLETASLLKNEEAIQAVVESAIANVNISNCLQLQDAARRHKFAEMQDKINRFVEWNFEEISRQKAFLSLEAEHLREIIRSDNLRIKSEEFVYEAVYRWYMHDRQNRNEYAEWVFDEVRFCQIPENVLIRQVIPDLVEKENLCSKQVEKAIEYHSDPSKPSRPRKPVDSIYVLSRRDSIAERFDPVQNTCVPCYSMVPVDDGDGEYRCAVKIGDDLHAVYESRVEKYDPVALCWLGAGPGIDTRDAAICAGKNCIYVVGGKNNGEKVYKYTAKNSKWTELPNMAERRRLPGAVCVGTKLYVMGGYGENGPLSTVECFNTKLEKWASLKPMNMARFQFGAVSISTSVYVIGGRDNSDTLASIEVLSPKAKSWKVLDGQLQEARNDFGVVAQGNEIFCFGGRGVTSIESFCVETLESKIIGNTGINNFSIDCLLFPSM